MSISPEISFAVRAKLVDIKIVFRVAPQTILFVLNYFFSHIVVKHSWITSDNRTTTVFIRTSFPFFCHHFSFSPGGGGLVKLTKLYIPCSIDVFSHKKNSVA